MAFVFEVAVFSPSNLETVGGLTVAAYAAEPYSPHVVEKTSFVCDPLACCVPKYQGHRNCRQTKTHIDDCERLDAAAFSHPETTWRLA